MDINTIKSFKKSFLYFVKKINKNIKSRTDKKVKFKDIIYCLSLHVGNNQSYDLINSYLKISNVLNVSTNTLIKNKNRINFKHFQNLNNELVNYIYKKEEKKIVAVDGTYIVLLKTLNKDGFKISKNGNYCIALLSTLFDIEKELPINYKISNNKDERSVLIKQLKYLQQNDILIMDRGYFSYDLLSILNKKHIKTIFRLKKI
jgi:hypothetical protein